jgi:outer membrane immunogenic protein
MKKLLLGAVALLALAPGRPALAADMPAAPVLKAPPPVVASWSGLYVGLGVGFRSSLADVTVLSRTELGVDVLAGDCAEAAPAGGCVTGAPLNDTAFRVSPYIGVNWQFAPQWLVGLEADWGFADKTTTLGGFIYPATNLITDRPDNSFSVRTTWEASLRARVGFLVDPSVLFYATGGIAWLHLESTSNCSANPIIGLCGPSFFGSFSPPVISHSATRTGWTVGGGIEAMLWANWIVRGDYRYADFGTWRNSDSRFCPVGPACDVDTTMTVTYDVRVRTHTWTFGLAYKFGPAGAVAPAGMPVKAPVYKAPAPAVASWSGVYVGLGLGTRSTRTDVTVTDAAGGGFTSLAAFCALVAASGGCLTSEPFNDTAWRINPYVGFNWHFAPQVVVGVEADWGFADKTTTLGGFYYPLTGPVTAVTGNAADSFSVKTTWDASLRARLGFLAYPSVLVYATGGAAWLHVESTSTCNAIVPFGNCQPTLFNPPVITHAHNRLGWTAGGGIEAMLWSSWIARAEYRYADFGSISNTDTRLAPLLLSGTETVSYDVRVRTHTALLGLAYKFGDSAVVARY